MIGLILLTAITLLVTAVAVEIVFMIAGALFSVLAYLFTNATAGGVAVGMVIGLLLYFRTRKGNRAGKTSKAAAETAKEITEMTEEITESRNNGTGCAVS